MFLTYALDWLARQLGVTGYTPPLPQGPDLAKAYAQWKLQRNLSETSIMQCSTCPNARVGMCDRSRCGAMRPPT